MAVNAAEIDAKVANGQMTALAGAMAKLRFIGPQALTPAEASLTKPAAAQPESNVSQNALGSAFSPAAVLAAAGGAAKPTPQGNAAASGTALATGVKPGAFETTVDQSAGLAKAKGGAGAAGAAAAKAMEAKAPPVLASGTLKAKGQGVGGYIEEDNPWRNGEAAQAAGELLDKGTGGLTAPQFAKNYAASSLAKKPSPETTPLDPSKELAFQAWAAQNGIKDVNSPDAHYDYRGFWMATNGAPHPPGSAMHFPDTFKQHDHPTFSVESKYSKGPNDGGSWNGETFIPGRGSFMEAQPGNGVKFPSTGEIPNVMAPKYIAQFQNGEFDAPQKGGEFADLPGGDPNVKAAAAAKKQGLLKTRADLINKLNALDAMIAAQDAAQGVATQGAAPGGAS